MSLWENPVKREYDMLTKNKSNIKNDDIKYKVEENDNIIDLSTLMQKEEKKISKYISSPIVARYNGSRADNFSALKMANVSNKYLEFAISNENGQTFIH